MAAHGARERQRRTHRVTLSAEETAEEYLMMSLRLAEGCDLSRLARLGYRLDPAVLADLAGMNLVTMTAERLQCTVAGRLVLNEILRRLMVG